MGKEHSNLVQDNLASQDNSPEKQSKEEVISGLSVVLSFHQSRLGAERTLMANIRTAVSLFGFGFALFQFYRYLQKEDPNVPFDTLPRNFGLSLAILGMVTIILGLIYHNRFIIQISKEREVLKEKGLLPKEGKFPLSMMIIISIVLLAIMLAAIISMVIQSATCARKQVSLLCAVTAFVSAGTVAML